MNEWFFSLVDGVVTVWGSRNLVLCMNSPSSICMGTGDFLVPAQQFKHMLYVSPEEGIGLCLILTCAILSWLLFFFLHSLIALICNFLTLLCGTQRRSWRDRILSSLKEVDDMKRLLYLWKAPQDLLRFNLPFSLIFFHLEQIKARWERDESFGQRG